MSATPERVAAVRALADWAAIAHDLAHLPVVWDDTIAHVVGQGYRGATDDEIERIVQVVTAHLRVGDDGALSASDTVGHAPDRAQGDRLPADPSGSGA